MRVSRSGGWMSTVSPHWNREMSRSLRPVISFGGRSEERTICRFAWCRVLNVWKNYPACVPCGKKLDIVDDQDVHAPEIVGKFLRPVFLDRLDDFDRKFLAGHVRDVEPGILFERRVADRLIRCVLPSPTPP